MTHTHTPGPWAANGTTVFFPHNLGGFSIHRCPDAEANAHLIAAAPDMLAALEAIEGALPAFNAAGDERVVDPGSPRGLVRAAIAKAKIRA